MYWGQVGPPSAGKHRRRARIKSQVPSLVRFIWLPLLWTIRTNLSIDPSGLCWRVQLDHLPPEDQEYGRQRLPIPHQRQPQTCFQGTQPVSPLSYDR